MSGFFAFSRIINIETSFCISLSSFSSNGTQAEAVSSLEELSDFKQLTPFSIFSTKSTNSLSLLGVLKERHCLKTSHTVVSVSPYSASSTFQQASNESKFATLSLSAFSTKHFSFNARSFSLGVS